MAIPYLARSRWLAVYVLPHEPAMRVWLTRTIQVPESDIDDIIQETYAILAKLESVDTIRDGRAYAFQVAKSVFLQSLRRSKIVTIETVANLAEIQAVDDAPSPEQHALGQRELRRVEAAIRSMPIQVGKVFWSRRVDGLSQRETAERLCLAEHTVEKYMAKGMKMLLAQFEHGGNVSAESSRVRNLELVGSEPANVRSENSR